LANDVARPPQYEALLHAAASLRACTSRDQILSVLPVAIHSLIACDYIGVSFLDPDGGEDLRFVSSDAHSPLVPLAEATPGMNVPEMASRCAVPLTSVFQTQLGSLIVASRTPNAFAADEPEILSFLAGQVSARLVFEESRKRCERAELILEVNNNIASNLDLQALLRSTAQSLRQALRCDFAGIAIAEGSYLRTLATDFPDSRGYIKEGNLLPIDGSILGRAFLTRQRILKTGGPDPGDPVFERATAEGIRFACFCPLVHQDRALGVLTAGRRTDEPLSEADSRLLGDVANQVAIALDNALAYRQITELKDQLAQEKLYLEDEIRSEGNFEEIVGTSAALRRVLKQVETVAPTDSNVLIYGETGSGKELIARAIHDLSSRRSNTFVKLNCAAIPTGLLESELFGHERGAFTGAVAQRIGRFELANRGTIFLDEVGEIPLELQPKLLRVLQEREFERLGSSRTFRSDARLIAATNRDLASMVGKQAFRADLFYRLNVFPVHVPPLRERPEDIPLLVRHFVQQFARRMNKTIETIPAESMNALTKYAWPGNIRELQNLIERATILSTGAVLRVPLEELKAHPAPSAGNEKNQTLEEAERAHILAILKETNWVLAGPGGAAARLGMNRSTLRFRMGKLGISRPA